MRSVVVNETVPQGTLRLVGVLGGEPLDEMDVEPADLERMGFRAGPGETLLLHTSPGPVMFFGLGEEADADSIRMAAGSCARKLPTDTPVVARVDGLGVDGAGEALVEGFLVGSYRFDEYRTERRGEYANLHLEGDVDDTQLSRSLALVDGICQARDWVNRPPEDKAPQTLASDMASFLSRSGYEVEIWDEERIASERLGGLLGVAAGSERPPRMLVARRAVGDRPALALVGKGIVFDSGGLSLKSPENMATMKGDMAGAATVVAAAGVVGQLGIDLPLSVFVPLTDNMPGGGAMRLGDVLRIRNGKTIEVMNTDAEGRLVLADALSLACEEDPALVVDVATLTGASRVALGDRIAAVFSRPEEAGEEVQVAARRAGETIWRLPLDNDQRKLIDSSVADMKNTGGRYGGAITAALLLAEFVGETPWAHLDIAGPSFFREDHPLGPKGGSGYGVATLVALADALSNR